MKRIIQFLLFATIFLLQTSELWGVEEVVTKLLIPLLFMFSLQIKSQGIKRDMFIWILFMIISSFSYVNVFNVNIFIQEIISLLGVLILGYSIYMLSYRYDVVIPITYAIILSAVTYFYYVAKTYGLSFDLLGSRVRLMDIVNSNKYGYISYLTSISIFLLFNRVRRFIKLILVVILLMCLFLILASASRGGVIIFVLINVWFFGFIQTSKGSKRIVRFIRNVVSFLFIIAVVSYVISLMSSGFIGERFVFLKENNVTEISRGVAIIETIKIFIENPIFGVGLGHVPLLTPSGAFSHNTYIEILASQGVFAFFVFIYLLYYFYDYSKKKCHNKYLLKLKYLFLVSFMLYSNLYVFHRYLQVMFFFFFILNLNYDFKKKDISNTI